MNSNYAKKSAADMRAEQKMKLEQAAAVQPTVAVMEPNWKALISSLTQMAETEAQIQEQLDRLQMLATHEELDAIMANVWNKLAVLATRGEIQHVMNKQLRELKAHQVQSAEAIAVFQQAMTASIEEAQQRVDSMMTSTEKRFGQMQEQLSKTISAQQEKLRKWQIKCLLIGLIPSLLQLILLVMQLI